MNNFNIALLWPITCLFVCSSTALIYILRLKKARLEIFERDARLDELENRIIELEGIVNELPNAGAGD
jgi:hypothetical protein